MLTRKYTACGQTLTLKCSALTPRLYRAEFGRDMLRDFQTLTGTLAEGMTPEAGEILEQVLYIMAKHGGSKNTETIEQFLEQFESPVLYYNALQTIFDLWNAGMEMTSASPKKKGAPRGKTTEPSSC